MGSVAILAGGGYAVANGTMTLGELMSFYVVVGLLRSRATTIAAAVPLVQQEPTFFSGSILENVAYGADVPDVDRAREACRVATAQDFVESLTDGYQTQIGDKGVRLSGGQRQRLAIARALYRTPKLLILDEPTNHLDVDSISRFLENLKQQDAGPTTLIVSHDYRVVAQADQVYALKPVSSLSFEPKNSRIG